jgi:lipopolysaccharide export system permease protein
MPIGIIIDISEKIHRLTQEDGPPFGEIVYYYFNFIIYFSNFLFPLFLFLSSIWFTSKLANNTEIIALLSSGISFNRFLRPYFIGSTIVAIFAALMSFFVVPKANKDYLDFIYKYMKPIEVRETSNVFREINPGEFIYSSGINPNSKTAFNFTFEKFEGNQLKYKIAASRIKFNEKDTTYTMWDYKKRTVGEFGDRIYQENKKDTVFSFDLDDLTPTFYVSTYEVQLYRKIAVPISAFILTLIAVSVSSRKKRGGMGINLAIGIFFGFTYVFFDKIFLNLAEKNDISPLAANLIPNIIFLIIGLYFMKRARQ